MTFDNITGSKKLWSVRLDGEEDNEFLKLFYDWSDVMWLRSFFKENINDLSAYFKITDINQAIKDTIQEIEMRHYGHISGGRFEQIVSTAG